MMKYYVNSLRDDVVEEFQNMDVFMGKGKYVGPKNKKDTLKKVEDVSNKSVKETLLELKELMEAVDPKLGRAFNHLEDLVFFYGSAGTVEALEHLKERSYFEEILI